METEYYIEEERLKIALDLLEEIKQIAHKVAVAPEIYNLASAMGMIKGKATAAQLWIEHKQKSIIPSKMNHGF